MEVASKAKFSPLMRPPSTSSSKSLFITASSFSGQTWFLNLVSWDRW
jgi:hypothetical protein